MVDGVPCSFMKAQTFQNILSQADSKYRNYQVKNEWVFFPLEIADDN